MGALLKITSRSPEEIKLYLDVLLKRLALKQDSLELASFSKTFTHEK